MSDNDSSLKNTSGLSDMAQRALDAILGRGKDEQDEENEKGTSRSVGRRESSGGGSTENILSAGTQSAASATRKSTSPPTGDADSGVRIGSQAGSSSGATDIASAGAGAASSTIAGGSQYDTSRGSGVVEEEEFVGSGGVGSAEFMEALRKGHEAAGGEYTSDLSDPNNPDDGPKGV